MPVSTEYAELGTFVEGLSPMSMELWKETHAFEARKIRKDDPLAKVIVQTWQESLPQGVRKLGHGSGGQCFAVGRSLLYPDTAGFGNEEHVIKVTMDPSVYSMNDMTREAKAYKRMTALQGICIPTLLEYIQFEITWPEYTQLTDQVRSDYLENNVVCESCYLGGRLLLQRPCLSSYTPDSAILVDCCGCECRLLLEALPTIQVRALVLKEVGTDLEDVLQTAFNLGDESKEAQNIVGIQVQRQWDLVRLYLREEDLEDHITMALRNIIVLVSPEELAEMKSPEEFSRLKILIIDFGKWDSKHFTCPTALDNHALFMNWFRDHDRREVRMIVKRSDFQRRQWPELLKIVNKKFAQTS